MTPAQGLFVELLGTALLLAAVVGSGIMGRAPERRQRRDRTACQPLATVTTLVTLILTFGAVSGVHFNPAVTLADARQEG